MGGPEEIGFDKAEAKSTGGAWDENIVLGVGGRHGSAVRVILGLGWYEDDSASGM